NGQLYEVILDRASLTSAVSIAEDGFCIGLARLRLRLTSILIAYRCAVAGKGADFIRTALPDTDDPAKDVLVKAALAGCSEVASLAVKCGMTLPENPDASDIASSIHTLEDEYIAKSAFTSMGIAPLISYYLRADREVSGIRVILSCKRCGLSDEACRKRVGL
ncbi:MAG: V-type ATPase subunit, partial [Clostridia bacterium]|nr:V-type ATPase subunit [Clostridia bacterium]